MAQISSSGGTEQTVIGAAPGQRLFAQACARFVGFGTPHDQSGANKKTAQEGGEDQQQFVFHLAMGITFACSGTSARLT
jgi:hypothetical protein